MSRVTWLLTLPLLLAEVTRWGDGCPALVDVAPLHPPSLLFTDPMLFGYWVMVPE
jgi:hypothetical protein